MSVTVIDAGRDYGAVIVSRANLAIDRRVLWRNALRQDATHLMLQNEIPEALNLTAVQAARAGIRMVLTAAPARDLSDALAEAVDILVVNAGEAKLLCGQRITSLDEPEAAARTSARQLRVVVVTAGRGGVAVAGPDLAHAEPGNAVMLVSAQGVGCCFIGTMAAHAEPGHAFDQGRDLRRSGRRPAGFAVRMTGAGTCGLTWG